METITWVMLYVLIGAGNTIIFMPRDHEAALYDGDPSWGEVASYWLLWPFHIFLRLVMKISDVVWR